MNILHNLLPEHVMLVIQFAGEHPAARCIREHNAMKIRAIAYKMLATAQRKMKGVINRHQGGIMYCDTNSLYVAAMTTPIPIGEYEWIDTDMM